jgi:hypothetical protein
MTLQEYKTWKPEAPSQRPHDFQPGEQILAGIDLGTVLRSKFTVR